MIKDLPIYISLLFSATTSATLLLFYWVVKNSRVETVRNKAGLIIFGLAIWMTIQAVLSINDVYKAETNLLPPKILVLGVLPVILLMLLLFVSRTGRVFIDSLPLKNITWLNAIRIPVELVLFFLFINGAVPELMTFEGRNFDIVAGATAPFVAYLGWGRRSLGSASILSWNLICLALLLNIVVNAFLSVPSPIQKFAFDQPNIAVLNFPFSWLPTFIVPVVLFGHLVSIRQLSKSIANL